MVISFAILTVYLGLPTRNYYWDGIGFAQAIEDAPQLSPSLIHPNHLIYTAAGYLGFRLVQTFGIHARVLTVLRVTNSILSAAIAYLFFGLLMECFASAGLSVALTLLMAFSATWWKFSTDANAYVPAVLLLMVSFRLALPGRASRPALAGLTHAVAMLFHELSILFFPVMLLGLWQQSSSLPLPQRIRILFRYMVTTILMTAPAYLVAYSWVQHEHAGSTALGPVSFWGWVTSHSPDASFSWDLRRDLLLSLRGNLRLFVGGRVAWAVRQWPHFSAAMILILIGLLSALAYRLLPRNRPPIKMVVRDAKPGYRAVLSLTALWIGCYLVFLFFWLPGNTFYRLFYLPALILLAGTYLARRTAGRRANPRVCEVALVAAIMAISNLTFDIFPNSRVQSNPPLQFALGMNRFWNPGTVVYYGTFNTDDWTIRYFHPETAWKPWQPPTLTSLDAALAPPHPQKGGVWLDTTALELLARTPGGPEWLGKHTPEKQHAELVDAGHRIIFQRIGSGDP